MKGMRIMKNRKDIPIPNLADISFAQTLDLAYQTCKFSTGKTYEDIAEEMQKGVETIRRYFTDTTYNPPTHLLPRLCKVIGNTILIDWLCIHAGGTFILHDEIPCNESLETQVAELTKEFSEVLNEDGKARLDGDYNLPELSKIEKEINHLLKKAEQVKKYISIKKELMK